MSWEPPAFTPSPSDRLPGGQCWILPETASTGYGRCMDKRDEVREFLTRLRGRITPERAGVMLFGGERRVSGLRREEVAQLAGVSTAYYTRMERGDLSGVSESVLYSLARALHLNDAETQHLLDLARLASGSPRRPARTRRQSEMPPRILQLIESMPDVPTVAITRLGTPVAANPLGKALMPSMFPADSPPMNVARYLFLDPGSQDFFLDWETTAREMVSTLRLIAGNDPTDRALAALVGELATRSEEFRIWWGSHTVRAHTTGTKRINHPVVGELELGYESLSIPGNSEIGLTVYLPEPGTTSADAVTMLRSWIAASPQSSTAAKG